MIYSIGWDRIDHSADGVFRPSWDDLNADKTAFVRFDGDDLIGGGPGPIAN